MFTQQEPHETGIALLYHEADSESGNDGPDEDRHDRCSELRVISLLRQPVKHLFDAIDGLVEEEDDGDRDKCGEKP